MIQELRKNPKVGQTGIGNRSGEPISLRVPGQGVQAGVQQQFGFLS